MLDELWNAAFAPTNLLGTLSNSAQMLDALYHSLPATWHVKLQSGQWELYDANKTARTHAFGKAGKARYPVRMILRAKGAKLSWMSAFRTTEKGAVATVVGAKTLPQAIRAAEGGTLKLISSVAYSTLPLRGALGSTGIGLAITIGPQLFVDASSAGLFNRPADKSAWQDFALKSANSQSGNVAGMVGGAAAVALGIGVLAVTSAPVLILVGLAGGLAGQAMFNAFGLNDDAENAARWLLGR